MKPDHVVLLYIKRAVAAMAAVLLLLMSGCVQRAEPDDPSERTIETMSEEVCGSSAGVPETETMTAPETDGEDISFNIPVSVPDGLSLVDFAIDEAGALLLFEDDSGSQVLREYKSDRWEAEINLDDHGITASFVAGVNGFTVLADRSSCFIWVLDDEKKLSEYDSY